MSSLADQYNKLVGRPAQQAFKLEWAAQDYEKAQQSKKKSTVWRMVDTTKGEYMSFGMVVKREGGWKDESAILAATKYCQKADFMGPPWVIRNAMTERNDFLYHSKQFVQDFEQSWGTYTESKAAGGDGAGGDSRGLGDDDNKNKMQGRGSSSSGNGAAKPGMIEPAPKRAKKGSIETKVMTPESNKKDKKEVDKLLAEATKWKSKFIAAMADIQNLDNQIATRTEWEWARNAQQAKDIKDRKIGCETVAATTFVKDLLSMGSAFIKANYDDKTMLTECHKLQADESVERLGRFVKRLKQMHNTAQKSKSP